MVRPNCAPIASASAASPHIRVHYGFHYVQVTNDPLQELSAKMVGGCIFGGGHIFKRLQYRGNFTIRVVLLFNLASFSKVIVWQLDISASSWYDSRFFEHSSYILQGDVITLSAITLSTTY